MESLGDTGRSGDESCTKLDYLHHPGKNLIGLTKQAFDDTVALHPSMAEELVLLK